MTINGVRVGVPNAGSYYQGADYASSANIWAQIRIYDWVARRWTGWSGFALLNSGYTIGDVVMSSLLPGGYTWEVQYAKKVFGTWEYRTQYAKVYQQVNNWLPQPTMPQILGMTGSNYTCNQ